MEVDREINDVEDQLRNNSLEEIESCSSSILDSPRRDDVDDVYDDDDDYEDGINVTLLSVSAAAKSHEEIYGSKKMRKEFNAPTAVADAIDANAATAANTVAADNSAQLNSKGPGTPTEVVTLSDKKAKRLNGAGKKRFKYLISHGHSHDEARVLAAKPFKVPYSDPNKRRRNAELSESNSSETNPPKRVALDSDRGNASQAKSSVQSRLDTARRGDVRQSSTPKQATNVSNKASYSEVLNSIRIGILPDGYPHVELTTQQLVATQKAILRKVAEQRKEKTKPKFGNCFFRPGHMIIICKNQDTVDWLKATTPSIKPWEEACLIAIEEKDIPRPEILLGFFPRSVEDTNEDILAFVESQNEGLMVDAWKILKRYTVKQYHVELVLTVDAVSMETLEKCDFTLDYKFGVAYLRKKSSRKSGNNEESQQLGGKKEKGDSEQSNTSSRIHEIFEDAEMRETNQRGTEASGITNSEPDESCNATANVEGCFHNAHECPQESSGTKNIGNSALPALCSESNSSLNKDDRLGHRPKLE